MLYFLKRLLTVFCNNASLIKTLYYNFKYLEFKQAVRLPIIVAKGVSIIGDGKIIVDVSRKGLNPRIYFGGKSLNWMPECGKNPTVFFIEGLLEIKEGFYFGSGGGIEVAKNAKISFAENFNATGKCTIVCRNNISFASDVLISWNTLIMDSDQHSVSNNVTFENINYDGSIKVGSHVWISANSTLLKNCIIPDNCIIGANSVCNKMYDEPCSIIAGNPAVVKKHGVNWSYDKPMRESML